MQPRAALGQDGQAEPSSAAVTNGSFADVILETAGFCKLLLLLTYSAYVDRAVCYAPRSACSGSLPGYTLSSTAEGLHRRETWSFILKVLLTD